MKSDRKNKETGWNDFLRRCLFHSRIYGCSLRVFDSPANLILGFFTCKFFGEFFASIYVFYVVLLRPGCAVQPLILANYLMKQNKNGSGGNLVCRYP